MEFGLNLYSVRNLIATEEGLLDTAEKLKQMGYRYLQYSGAPFDAARIKRMSEATGLPVVLTHVPMDRILNDTENLMAEHALFGCRNIGLGAMPREVICDLSQCRETVAQLERAACKMAERGFRFFYHHHHYEFYRHEGKTVFDRILDQTPHINLTLDTYWLQYGGADVLKTVDRAAGRVECIHLKDYMITAKPGERVVFEPSFAPVGDGNLDFAAVLSHAKAAGAKYFLVEQDNAAVLPDTLGQVERSAVYLNKNFG